MTTPEFLAWQWNDYPANHRHRLNLAIHIVAVPRRNLAGTPRP